MNRKFKRTVLFDIKIFYNIVNAFSDQFNAL